MKLHLKESINGYEPIPNNLSSKSFTDILLGKLKPYEDVFLQIYDELPKNSQKTYLKNFNRYKQEFKTIGQEMDAKYAGATYDPDVVYTRMEHGSSPRYWEDWSRSIMGSAYSTEFVVNLYKIEMKDSKYNVSYIVFKDGSVTFGVPTDNKSWLNTVDYYRTVLFFSKTDAEKFAAHFRITGYTITKMSKAYSWARHSSAFSNYRLLDSDFSSTSVAGIPVICGTYDHPTPRVDNNIGFTDFTQLYNTNANEKANIRTIILNPISKKYNLTINKSDAGDEYYNTEYTFYDRTAKDSIFSLTYYSKGPADNAAKYSIQTWFNIPDAEGTKVYRKDSYNYGKAEMEFWLEDYNGDLLKMMKSAKQAIEIRLDNYYNKNELTTESYNTDEDDYEEVQDYAIGFIEEDGSEYEDGAYFTILYNPVSGQYSWKSSIEFEPDGTFDTFDDAYDNAIEAHEPGDGSELYAYEV